MDDHAFAAVVEPHRRELLLHCYRMLGSLTDAEDALQETLLAAWRGMDGFEGRSSLRTWLYRIATTRCLNVRRGASRRVPAPVPPFEPPAPTRLGEVTWLQPYPDALLDGVPDDAPGPDARYEMREAVSLAFIAALQRMPPRQAATLILRDVLGYPTEETADLLGVTATAAKGLLQRARTAAGDDGPAATPADQDLVDRFAHAFSVRDMPALLALLTDDAWLAMPPAPHEYHGPEAIAGFLAASPTWRYTLRLEPAGANRQPAFACFLDDAPAGLLVLTARDDRIAALTRFLEPGPR
ncbi:RNA polymerase subunit sigma-70 [Actinoplanes sp. NPDC026619]|uniref:RNA polymerase subunit sigma-70 n=1 Tax=Actinoplanes sp. NPDC026619 TaxID=3155798 RepID=UPI00340EDBE7